MKFTADHLETFQRLSHDRNPLHCVEAYARRTHFGQRVMYGIGAALYGLGVWSKGRKFELQKIKVDFTKALFLDQEYELETEEDGNSVTLKYLHGSQLQTTLSFSWIPWRSPGAESAAPSDFHPLRDALEVPRLNGFETPMDYAMDYTVTKDLTRHFFLAADQLPRRQLEALLWSSYFVGMICPGKQALLFNVRCDFSSEGNASGTFKIRDLTADFDPRLNMIKVKAEASGCSLRIQAFKRPQPVTYDQSTIAHATGQSQWLVDKVAFISGASRGFGAVLARAFALHGAEIIINYRSDFDGATQICKEIGEAGGKAWVLQGDVGDAADSARMRSLILEKCGGLDVLVNNAAPPIFARKFRDQDIREFESFVVRSLQMATVVSHMLTPILRPSALVVSISSAYTVKPERLFSHYITSKSAVEGFMRSLASEFPEHRFVIVRPPRMLTDQTNLPFQIEPPASAADVAGRLVSAMQALPATPNLQELDLL